MMPATTVTELVMGALAALGIGAGGTGVAIARRKPGSVDDYESRISAVERRVEMIEAALAQAIHDSAESTRELAKSSAQLTTVTLGLQRSIDAVAADLREHSRDLRDVFIRMAGIDVATQLERGQLRDERGQLRDELEQLRERAREATIP